MATPQNDSYTIQSGSAVYAGRRNLPTTGIRVIGPASSTVPFMAGMPIPKGLVPTGTDLVTSENTAHVTVKRTWNDGSAKHVVVSGTVVLGPSGGKDVTLYTGTPVGTPLTEAAIVSAAPSASVTLGALGTVNLSSLLGSPFRTWISTPNVVECHYVSKALGSSIYVWFHVRRYSAGHTFVRVIVERSALPFVLGATSYIPSVSIGGNVVWDNSGAPYIHAMCAGWSVEGWAHGGAEVTYRHDIDFIAQSELVPSYFIRNPTQSTLNALHQTYVPGSVCGLREAYTGTGYHAQIGLLPAWDTMYLTTGDTKALKAVIANSLALRTHATMWRNVANNLPMKPSDRPTQGYQNNGDGFFDISAEDQNGDYLKWDIAHHASSGYLAYMLTGEYVHLEAMQHQLATIYMGSSHTGVGGTGRIVYGQTRGTGWWFRTCGQVAALCPDGDPIGQDAAAWLQANAVFHKAAGPDTYPNSGLGWPMASGPYASPATSTLKYAPWMMNFWIQSMGHVSDLEPLSDMISFNALRDWMYRGAVGMTGDGSPGTYDFRYAGLYNIQMTPLSSGDRIYPAQMYQNWGDVWEQTKEYTQVLAESPPLYRWPQNAETNRLYPASGSGDWGYVQNIIPAVAYAAKHGAPGAEAGLQRILRASNWSVPRENLLGRPGWSVQDIPDKPQITIEESPSIYPVWRQTMAANTWAAIPASNTLQSIDPEDNPTYNPAAPSGAIWHGNGGLAEIVRAWSGAVYDQATDTMIVWGGGHGDYAGNEPYKIRIDQAVPSWLMIHPPSGSGVVGETAAYLENTSSPATVGTYFDGKPRSQHTYDKIVWLPGRGMLLGRNIGGFPTGDLGDNKSYLLDVNAGTWSVFAEPAGSNPASVNAYCLDTARNQVWRFSPGSSEVYKLPVDAPTWAVQSTTGWNGTGASQHFYVSCEYLPEHDVCVVLSGRSALTSGVATYPSQLRVFDCATNTWYLPTMNNFSVTAPVIHNWGYTHPAWASGAVWIWHNQPSYLDKIVRLTPGANPRTDAWTADLVTATSGTPPVKIGGDGAEDRGTYGRFSYSPRLNGFVLFNGITQQPYFYALE